MLVVGEDQGFGETDGSRVAVFCGAGNGFGGDEADAVFEGFFVQAVPVGNDDLGDAFEHAGGDGELFAFPGAQSQAEGAVQDVVAVFFIDELHGDDGADAAGFIAFGDLQLVYVSDQGMDHDLHFIPGFDVGLEDFVGGQGFGVLLLLGEDVGFLFVAEVVINHAPDRGLAGAGPGGDDFDGVLAVDHIVDSVPLAHFDRFDLVQVKILCRAGDVVFLQVPLVVLVGDQVVDRDQFKAHVRDTGALFRGQSVKVDHPACPPAICTVSVLR